MPYILISHSQIRAIHDQLEAVDETVMVEETALSEDAPEAEVLPEGAFVAE